MSFQAKYPGRCGACDDRIHEGELVTYADDELVHVSCESADDQDDPSKACGKCFTIHAGECI